jgi:hypothetical protein
MKARTIFWVFMAAVTLARLWLVVIGDISGQNAYFYACAANPAPAYFDGPPGTALVVLAAARVDSFWWQALGVVWAVLATAGCVSLGRRLAGSSAAYAAAAVLNVLPMFNEAAMACGPDLPALALMLAAAAMAWDASRSQHGWSLRSWAGAAFCSALACVFAYWAAFAAAGVVGACLVRPAQRKPANSLGAALVLVACAGALAWPMAWNARQEWIPVAGWTFRALSQFRATDLLGGILSFGTTLSPLLLLLLVYGYVRAARGAVASAVDSFALVAGLPGVLMSLFAMYRGWPPGGPLLWVSAIVFPLVAAALLPRTAWIWWLGGATALAFAIEPMSRQISRPTEIAAAARHVIELDQRLSDELPGGLFFIAAHPDLASVLGYHLQEVLIPPPGHPRVYTRESQDISNQYAIWESYDKFIETSEPPDEAFAKHKAVNPFLGRSAIYVGPEPPDQLPQAIGSAFAEVQLVQEAGGLFIYLCLDYQTLPL